MCVCMRMVVSERHIHTETLCCSVCPLYACICICMYMWFCGVEHPCFSVPVCLSCTPGAVSVHISVYLFMQRISEHPPTLVVCLSCSHPAVAVSVSVRGGLHVFLQTSRKLGVCTLSAQIARGIWTVMGRSMRLDSSRDERCPSLHSVCNGLHEWSDVWDRPDLRHGDTGLAGCRRALGPPQRLMSALQGQAAPWATARSAHISPLFSQGLQVRHALTSTAPPPGSRTSGGWTEAQTYSIGSTAAGPKPRRSVQGALGFGLVFPVRWGLRGPRSATSAESQAEAHHLVSSGGTGVREAPQWKAASATGEPRFQRNACPANPTAEGDARGLARRAMPTRGVP